MKTARFLPILIVVIAISGIASAQAGRKAGAAPKPAEKCELHEPIHEDLAAQVAKFKLISMPFSVVGLSEQERNMVGKLVDASRQLELIYWHQSDPKGLELLKKVTGCNQVQNQKLRRFLTINGSRYDLLEENKPFVGNDPFSPGRNIYPQGITRAEIEAYVAKHPTKKDQIYSPYTVIKRQGAELITVPYHIEYKPWLAAAATNLKEAAALSPDKAFANFLRLRAEALLTDDYYKSDLAWLDLENPKFDIIFAPYETYLDDVLGVRGSYGAAVLVRNDAESAKLALYEKYVPAIQDALPLDKADLPSKEGQPSPMEVMDAPYRAGDLRHGYQAVADNLPNDPRIHAEKGTKKIFFKNFMDARVNFVILPIAQKLMPAAQAAKASGEGYLAGTLLHEICHGLGPVFARVDSKQMGGKQVGGKQMDIREAIGPAFSGLEEAKADVVGMFGLKWLVDHNALAKERLEEYYSSYVAG